MKILKNNQKVFYILSCILVAFFLYGCKEKEGNISVFDGLPESTLLTEIKTSLENHVPLAIAFTAEWCPHCRKYKPVFNEIKNLYRDKVTFINIDVDDANGSPISNRFQVRGIPTSAFVRADGSVLKLQVGEIDKEKLVQLADELMLNKKRKKGDPVAPFPFDIKKEEAAPKEEKKPEETMPSKEAPPPEVQEAPKEELPQPQPVPDETNTIQPPPPGDTSNEKIQLPPEPSVNEENNNLDSGNELKDDEAPLEEAVPGKEN